MSPRFNHIALSVPSSLLDDVGRAELVRFYGDLFGWTEMPTMTKPGARLVLQAYRYDQFVFVVSEDEPMRAAAMDHFGLAVDTVAEFETFRDRARDSAARDERVRIIDNEPETFGDFLTLHSFYVGFLLPMLVEVQCYEWAEGVDPTGGDR